MDRVHFPYRSDSHLVFLHVVYESGSWEKHGLEVNYDYEILPKMHTRTSPTVAWNLSVAIIFLRISGAPPATVGFSSANGESVEP